MGNTAVLRTNVLSDESTTFDVLLSDDGGNTSLEVNCESELRAGQLIEVLSLNGFTILLPFASQS